LFRKFLEEPLIQFFIAGFFLYILYGLVSDEKVSKTPVIAKKVIYIQDSNLSDNTLAIKKYEAVLLNEAYFLELYKQSRDISMILIEKMEYILANESSITEPSEDVLRQFYKNHLHEYSKINSLSFYVYKVNDKFTYRDMYNLLNIKPSGGKFKKNLSLNEIERRYGSFFTRKIKNSYSHLLSGVVRAKEGEYMFYVEDKNVSQPLDFDAVEGRVYNDYFYIKRLAMKKEAFEKIRKNYEIKVQ